MRKKIYIETSIPSFYSEDRSDAPTIARREWTLQWWDNNRDLYELVSSTAVIEELENGEYTKQGDCLSLLDEIPLLVIAKPEINEIVANYIKH